MKNSRHHLWQARWTIDKAAGTYVHECGLVVQFHGPDDTRGRANNAAQVQQALAVKNGHNAAAMITRMDDGVGAVMKFLREQGLDEQTLVMFSSAP